MEILRYGSTATVSTSSPTTNPLKRYFTVIQNVPQSMNREQLLSLLYSVGSVKGLQMINVQSATGITRRLGLVEVADNESVFRLTSRQFLVGDASTLIHKYVSCESRIVKYFDRYPDLNLQLSIGTQDTAMVGKVVKLFKSFGDIKVVSINSLKSDTVVSFKAPKNYSIGSLSTMLDLQIDGVWLKVNYHEETINEESLQLDPDFWNDFRQISQKPQVLISETAKFFHQNQFVENLDTCEHFIETPPTEEDDHLSSLSDDQEFEQFDETEMGYRFGYEYFSPSWVFQQESHSLFAGFAESLTHRLDNWHKSYNSALSSFDSASGFVSAKSLEGNRDGYFQDHEPQSLPRSEDKGSKKVLNFEKLGSTTNNKDKCPVIVLKPALPMEENPKHVNSGAQAISKQKQAKTIPAEVEKSLCAKSKESQAKVGKKTPGTPIKKEEPEKDKDGSKPAKAGKKNKLATQNHDNKQEPQTVVEKQSRSDGTTLLSLITCIPDDYEQINKDVMKLVHEKWRRFAEIKDQMRMEKYQEYLNQKKQEGQASPSSPIQGSTQ